MSEPLVILVEHTPDPHTLRLDPGLSLGAGAGLEFTARDGAQGASPLAARLLGIEGVARVLIHPDFVSVTKSPERAWSGLGERVVEELRAFLQSGEAPLRPGVAGAPARASTDDATERELRRIVEEEIRPAVAADGGDVEYLGYREGVVEVRLRGACAGCSASARTLSQGMLARLRRAVPDLVAVTHRDG